MKKILILLLINLFITHTYIFAQIQDSIKILILYGSKPNGKGQKYKPGPNCHDNSINETEQLEKGWANGRFGGHIAILMEDDRVLSFQPRFYRNPKPHVWPHKSKNATFKVETTCEMWESFYDGTFDYPIQDLKRTILSIPVTKEQNQKIKEITGRYLNDTPYDYAFFGMRCSSATYEILMQLGAVKRKRATWAYVFSPKRFRHIMFKKQKKKSNTWKREDFFKCTKRRKWAHAPLF